MKRGMQPAPAQETFHQRDPAYQGDNYIGPIGVKIRRPRSEPPESQSKPQYPV